MGLSEVLAGTIAFSRFARHKERKAQDLTDL